MIANASQEPEANVESLPVLVEFVRVGELPARFDRAPSEHVPLPRDWLSRRVDTFRTLLREVEDLKAAICATSGEDLVATRQAVSTKSRLVAALTANAVGLPTFAWNTEFKPR